MIGFAVLLFAAVPTPTTTRTPTVAPMAALFSTHTPTPSMPPSPASLADLAARTKLRRDAGGAIVISNAGLQMSFPIQRPASKAEYAELMSPLTAEFEAERRIAGDIVAEASSQVGGDDEAEWSNRLALEIARIRTTAAKIDAIVPPAGIERLHASIRAFAGAVIDACIQAQNAATLKTREAFAEATRSLDRLNERSAQLKISIAALEASK
jgi:hypothetical protein